MEKDAFQNFDDPIQGESERIIFNYFSRRYNKWMEGDEDDMEDLKLLKRDFMKLHEIDPIRLADLVRQNLLFCGFRQESLDFCL